MNRTMPKVPGHFLLGNLNDFRKNRIEFLKRIPREHGEIARGRFGFFPTVYVSGAELMHDVLVERHDAFLKSPGLSIFARPLLGNGLLTSEREFHKKQRKMMAPAFVHKRIADYATTIASFADQSVGRLRGVRQVDLSEEMMHLTFLIVGKTLFNADVASDAKDVGEALTSAMRYMMQSLGSILPIPPVVPTPHNLKTRKIVERLDAIVYRIIRERRASGKDEGDFLSMLLLAQDEDDGSVMTDKQVRDEAMTILLAGHETTANALAWTFYLLAKHPEARAKLEAEVDAVLAGRAPALADLPRLPYTLQVLKESMRLFPPAYVVTRRTARDVTIRSPRGAHDVRKNEVVVLDIIGMHRRPEYFARPDDFDPSRFEPEREKAMTKHSYLPFGGGPRVCIGNHFAMMEGQIILAHLAQHLRFDLVPGRENVVPEPLVTLRPKGGVHVIVSERHPTHAQGISSDPIGSPLNHGEAA